MRTFVARSFWLALSSSLAFQGCSAWAGGIGDLSPLEAATAAVDRLRDEIHKRRMKVLWPDGQDSSSKPALPQIPDNAEVYLATGYIDYLCARLCWQKGSVRAERVSMRRTWFYNPEGESFSGERLEVRPEDFARVWLAARLILAARVEQMAPDPVEKVQTQPDGSVVYEGHGGSRYVTSSHEPYVLVWISEGGSQVYMAATRGARCSNDIRDFEEIRTQALRSLVEQITPRVKNGLTSAGKSFPVSEWNEFFANEVKSTPLGAGAEDVRDTSWLRLEIALRGLGETGFLPAEPAIKDLHEKLAGADPSKRYRAASLREEAGYALTKIEWRNRWSPERAAAVIHGTLHQYNAQEDLIKWARQMFFVRDREGCHQLLRNDLNQGAAPLLLRDTLAELQQRFPEEDLPAIAAFVGFSNPEVAADACFILLSAKTSPGESRTAALTGLGRLVSGTETPIAEHARWHDNFARARALQYLCRNAPENARWTAQRVREQLAKPEDGRMVHRLLSELECFRQPAGKEEKIAAYRLALSRPYSWGALTACQQLAELGDLQSAASVRRILAAILAGCNSKLSWQDDPAAKYPWTDKHDIEEISRAWDGLLKTQGNNN